MSDPRQAAQTRRRHEMDRLELLRAYRATVCGCLRCGDADRLDELAVRIKASQERIDELTELCCVRLAAMHQPI